MLSHSSPAQHSSFPSWAEPPQWAEGELGGGTRVCRELAQPVLLVRSCTLSALPGGLRAGSCTPALPSEGWAEFFEAIHPVFVVFSLTRRLLSLFGCCLLLSVPISEALAALQNPFAKLLQGQSELCPGRKEPLARLLSPWLLLAVSSTSGVSWQGSLPALPRACS